MQGFQLQFACPRPSIVSGQGHHDAQHYHCKQRPENQVPQNAFPFLVLTETFRYVSGVAFCPSLTTFHIHSSCGSVPLPWPERCPAREEHHAAHVVAGFAVRRNTLIAIDRAFTRVVGGGDQRPVAADAVAEPL